MEKGIKAWWIIQKTNIVDSVLLIFWKYKPRVESISKYKVIPKNTITIGRSLKGGNKASNNLSSILFPVFDIIIFTLFNKILATKLLTNKAKIIDTMMIVKSNKLIPIPYCDNLFNKISTFFGLASGVIPWPKLKMCGPFEKDSII